MEIDFYRTCKFSFINTAVGDVLRAIDGKSLMGSMILSFCIIDYMAQVTNGKWSGTRQDFKNYVINQLGDLNPRYKSLSEEMYAIRNSLIHSYGESDSTHRLNLQFLFSIDDFRDSHLDLGSIDSGLIMRFDLPKLIAEIVVSVISFFELNKANDALFEEWYLRKIKVNDYAFFHKRDILPTDKTFPYQEIHSSLTLFNEIDYNNEVAIDRYSDVIRAICNR